MTLSLLPAMNRTDLLKKARAAASRVLHEKGYISVVDVLMAMGRLSKKDHERWRFRQVPHLEAVLPGSLNQHSFFCRELRAYARDELQLRPSRTAYVSWGKGRRQPLRFSQVWSAAFGGAVLDALRRRGSRSLQA